MRIKKLILSFLPFVRSEIQFFLREPTCAVEGCTSIECCFLIQFFYFACISAVILFAVWKNCDWEKCGCLGSVGCIVTLGTSSIQLLVGPISLWDFPVKCTHMYWRVEDQLLQKRAQRQRRPRKPRHTKPPMQRLRLPAARSRRRDRARRRCSIASRRAPPQPYCWPSCAGRQPRRRRVRRRPNVPRDSCYGACCCKTRTAMLCCQDYLWEKAAGAGAGRCSWSTEWVEWLPQLWCVGSPPVADWECRWRRKALSGAAWGSMTCCGRVDLHLCVHYCPLESYIGSDGVSSMGLLTTVRHRC